MTVMRTRSKIALSFLVSAALFGLTGCVGQSGDPGSDPSSTLNGMPTVALAGVDGDVLQHLRSSDQARSLNVQWLMVGTTDAIYSFLKYDTARAVLGGDEALLAKAANPDLVNVGPVYKLADGFYSSSLSSVGDVARNASVALPADPTQQAEALKMLASQGVITVGSDPTIDKISENSRHLKFVVVNDPTKLVDAMKDSALVYIPAVEATQAKLTHPILLEPDADREVRILVATKSGAASGDVKELYTLLTSDATRQYLKDTFGGIVTAP